MTPAPAFLAVEALDLMVQGRVFARDLRFELRPAEILGLMGPSGAGKTSLLHCLGGFIGEDGGKGESAGQGLSYAGSCRWAQGSRPFRTGMVFQEQRLLPWRTIGQNLRLSAAGLDKSIRRRVAEELPGILASLGFDNPAELLRRYPRQLSGGMRQRVALARALLFGEELQLWDEPFQGLDPPRRQAIAGYLRTRWRAKGSQAIVASHDPGDMLMLCDRLLILRPSQVSGGLESLPVTLAEPDRVHHSPAFKEALARLEAALHRS